MSAKGTVKPSERPIVASEITRASTLYHGFCFDEELEEEEEAVWEKGRVEGDSGSKAVELREWDFEPLPCVGTGTPFPVWVMFCW